jgi:crotonobetainyl-CoA:carnitine CoA-transferase CaiB-like acyl-CoA transferase
MAGHAFAIARPAPAQGQHSVEILRETGFTDAEIAALSAGGTIVGNVSTD